VKLTGAIETITRDTVSGWACLSVPTASSATVSDLTRQPLVLRLKIDGAFWPGGQVTTGLVRKTDANILNRCMDKPAAYKSQLNYYAGFQFKNLPPVSMGVNHTYEVVELQRNGNPASLPAIYMGSLAGVISKQFNTTMAGFVDVMTATPTPNGTHVVLSGWACDPKAGYSPVINIYDDDETKVVQTTANIPRGDLGRFGCAKDVKGNYPYGFKIDFTFDWTKPGHARWMDGMLRNYSVRALDAGNNFELKLPSNATAAPPLMSFGNASQLSHPGMQRVSGHLITPSYASVSSFGNDLESTLANLSQPVNGWPAPSDLILLGLPTQIVANGVLVDQNSVDFPAALAQYHAEYLKRISAHGLRGAAILQALLYTPYTAADLPADASAEAATGLLTKVHLRKSYNAGGSWLQRWSAYLAELRRLCGQIDAEQGRAPNSLLSTMAYYYPVDEVFSSTTYFDAGGRQYGVLNGLTAMELGWAVDQMRNDLPGIKTMTSLAWHTFMPSSVDIPGADHLERYLEANQTYWDILAQHVDLFSVGTYPVGNVFDRLLDSACGPIDSSDYVDGVDVAQQANRCVLNKALQRLPSSNIMLLTQGILSDNGLIEQQNSVEENIHRLERSNRAVLSLINQDTSGRVVGFGNFIYHSVDAPGASTGGAMASDALDAYLVQRGIAGRSQSLTNFFGNLSQCAMTPSWRGRQSTGNSAFTCSP